MDLFRILCFLFAINLRSDMFELSKKLQSLPPYLFLEIDKAKRKARAEGRDIIDLGVGDPDQPTPPHIVKKMVDYGLWPSITI